MKNSIMLSVLLFVFIIPSQALSSSDTVPLTPSASSSAEMEKSPALIDPQEKQKLKEDALKLSENFRALFKDLSGMSQRVLKSAVDYIADWIDKNYEGLSKDKKEKLQLFLHKLQTEYAGLKDMSTQTLQKFLKEFEELLEQLGKDEPQQVDQGEQLERHI
ncbi:MAG: hypothetical protein KQH63_06980 [Desulfobulbaceae bacterium]|nr:hypothetical protein [Desulfobulbaceae bacterium]